MQSFSMFVSSAWLSEDALRVICIFKLQSFCNGDSYMQNMMLILREQSKARQRISQCIKILTLALSAGGIQTEGAGCIGYIIMVICIPILECV